MKKNKFLFIIIILWTLIADNSFIIPAISGTFLFSTIIFIMGKSENMAKVIKDKEYILPSIFFFIYIFFIDIMRGGNIIVHLSYALIPILEIFVFLYFKTKPKAVYFIFSLLITSNLLFQILQFSGIKISSIDIVSHLGFIANMELKLEDQSRGFRLSGLFSNTIGISCAAGLSLFYFYIRYNKYNKITDLLYAILCLFVIVFTNTRSVIFFAVPILILTDVICTKRISYKIIIAAFIFLGVFNYIQSKNSFKGDSVVSIKNKEFDYSVVERVQANILGTYGVLHLSPFFGMPDKEQSKAIHYGKTHLGLVYGDKYMGNVTYHCLPLFYLRIYGIIGFILFINCYWHLIKYTLSRKDQYTKQLLLTGLIFFFVYNLSHNVKLNFIYFWIFLASNYVLPRVNKTKKKNI